MSPKGLKDPQGEQARQGNRGLRGQKGFKGPKGPKGERRAKKVARATFIHRCFHFHSEAIRGSIEEGQNVLGDNTKTRTKLWVWGLAVATADELTVSYHASVYAHTHTHILINCSVMRSQLVETSCQAIIHSFIHTHIQSDYLFRDMFPAFLSILEQTAKIAHLDTSHSASGIEVDFRP